MKVLEKGELLPEKEWTGKFRCTGEGNGDVGCNALLLVSTSDLFLKFDSGVEFSISFRCPECGGLTDVKEQVPGDVRVRVRMHYSRHRVT